MIASQILLIPSIFNFVLAAPVAVREINEVRANAVEVAKVWMAASEKRMDPGDQLSTNAGYLTDESVIEWNTISSDSTTASSPELDTATSRPPSSTGPHPWSADDSLSPSPSYHYSPPSDLVAMDDLSPSYSVSTDYSPPSYWVSTDSPPPLHSVSTVDPPPSPPGPAGDPPPSHSVSTTDGHSPPSAEPQHSGAPESENFLDKLMKGKFKRRISGHDPGNVVQRELQGTVGPRACVSTLSLPLLPTFKPPRTTNILIFLCSIIRDLDIIE
jgi:hypothetical protein